jgi:hypothetical protein
MATAIRYQIVPWQNFVVKETSYSSPFLSLTHNLIFVAFLHVASAHIALLLWPSKLLRSSASQEYIWAECQWLTPIILATQEAEIRRITFRSQPGQIVCETLFRKTLSQRIGLVEWLKVKALSSSLSITNIYI